jgi:hypothetical protein
VANPLGTFTASQDISIYDVPFPTGPFKFGDCTYTGTSTAAGSLSCTGSANAVQCEAYQSMSPITCNDDAGDSDSTTTFVTMVYCNWP